jgi:hypothetical protein
MQFETDVHATRFNRLPPCPADGFGMRCVLQRLPFHRSASVTLRVDVKLFPTAKQVEAEAHDTPVSALPRGV